MSHIETSKLVVKDLDVLRKVLKKFPGAELVEADTYTWFGEHIGDYPVPEGFSKEDLGKTDGWKIKVKGSNYEIGLKKAKGASGYSLLFDFYGRLKSNLHDGPKLTKLFGDGSPKNKLCKLATAYRHEMLAKEARRMGKKVELIDSPEKLDKWNKAMRRSYPAHKPVKWKGKTLSIVTGA